MRAIVRETMETLILALGIFLLLQFSVQPTKVDGSSMEPTLSDGQRLILNKLVYTHFNPSRISKVIPFVDFGNDRETFLFHLPRQGEIVVFHFPIDPSRDFVKRVIGLPGDTIEIKRGKVYVNDAFLDEPYIKRPDRSSMKPITVEEEAIFVLGDNRRSSDDSRKWGTVPLENVVGRTWIRYPWPPDNWDPLSSVLPFLR